ncbi:IPT/TIG domain-containing protein, partial [Bradyrhizobium sp. UNPF46]
MIGTIAAANAACTVTTGSTNAATITINGTGGGNTVGLCVTNNSVAWGLYGSSNGSNPNVDAFNNYPMTAGGLTPTNLSYTTSKGTYTLVPVPDGGFTSFPEYDITLNSQSGGGTDTIVIWYASACTVANQCNFNPELTDTSFTITVNLPTPTVTAVSPTAGPTAGGNSVVITGANLTGTTGAGGVKFGATNATSYTVNSATQITAVAPAGAAGTVDVTVTNNGVTSATSAADQYTYVSPPTVTSVSPTQGPQTGGTTVVITGTNLSGASAVTFGATAATGFTVNSATQITATSP